MTEDTIGQGRDYIELAGDIVAAYVSNNPVPASELPALIASVHAAIRGLGAGATAAAPAEAEIEKPTPAQIRKSIQQDGIVSFLDGRAYKTLKRHLTSHGLTPDGYRARYGLPADYPMVAPAYSQARSNLAKAIGLGQPGAMAERETRGEGIGDGKGETDGEPRGRRKAA
ncbi:MucR family transcriptional regulator [Methylobacterium sp. NEAU 140]|uniref:MucR family transcriptional regulator n=1 Tax=Methylobacterium sp. NEAU 140 TaxID=3064945 RepID=UPI002733FBC5|nr:MucR family transcriptional regulator [Methylobacterium sp. NEAU 140]MDP4022311.1 MucR family transcriptional regulator [Methylobacterium sp. NEAU 140]